MKAFLLDLIAPVINCLASLIHYRKNGLGLPHVSALILVIVGVFFLGQVAFDHFHHSGSLATSSTAIRTSFGIALVLAGALIYCSLRIPGTPDDWFAWLEGSDQSRRHKAKLILGSLDPGARVPLDPIIARLSDSGSEPVFWAAIALGCLGAKSVAALPALTQLALSAPAFGVRQAAISALVKIAPESNTVKATLHQALEDHDPFVRSEALSSFIYLENIKESDIEAIQALEQDSSEYVRNGVEIAIRNISNRPPSGKPQRRR
jgi:HEAT repeats